MRSSAGADVLVLVPAGYTGTLAHDQVVTVTGKVRPYVTAELEKDYHWFKDGALVSRDTKVDFKTRPVLIASSLRTADGRDLLAGERSMTGDETTPRMRPTTRSDHGMMMSAGKLAKDSKKYYGQNVTVRAEVEDVLDSHSFTLDEDSMIAGPDVVVIVPAGFDVSRLAHDQVVTVSGKVRPYVMAELEKDYDWFKDGKIFTTSNKVDYKTRPVLIAETITTADGRTLHQPAVTTTCRTGARANRAPFFCLRGTASICGQEAPQCHAWPRSSSSSPVSPPPRRTT